LHLAKQLGYINEVEYIKFCSLTTEISKLLSGFIKTL